MRALLYANIWLGLKSFLPHKTPCHFLACIQYAVHSQDRDDSWTKDWAFNITVKGAMCPNFSLKRSQMN